MISNILIIIKTTTKPIIAALHSQIKEGKIVKKLSSWDLSAYIKYFIETQELYKKSSFDAWAFELNNKPRTIIPKIFLIISKR